MNITLEYDYKYWQKTQTGPGTVSVICKCKVNQLHTAIL